MIDIELSHGRSGSWTLPRSHHLASAPYDVEVIESTDNKRHPASTMSPKGEPLKVSIGALDELDPDTFDWAAYRGSYKGTLLSN